MTKAPSSPLIHPGYNGTALVWTGAAVVLEYIILVCVWQIYRSRQSNLPATWNAVDVKYLLALSSPSSALRVVHFLYSRVGPNRRLVIRITPWHFKHTLTSIQVGIILLGLIKSGGIVGLIGAGIGFLVIDTVWLVKQQAEAAFGTNDTDIEPKLDYHNKPRFAWAAVLQVLVLALSLFLMKFDVNLPSYIGFFFPIASFGTLLMYLLHGHEADYLNQSSLTKFTHCEKTNSFCDVCQSQVFSRNKVGSTHHPTSRSLEFSAQKGCRICTTVWEQRSRVQKNFISQLKGRQPATTFSLSGGLTIGYSQDVTRRQSCKFQIRKRLGQYAISCYMFF